MTTRLPPVTQSYIDMSDSEGSSGDERKTPPSAPAPSRRPGGPQVPGRTARTSRTASGPWRASAASTPGMSSEHPSQLALLPDAMETTISIPEPEPDPTPGRSPPPRFGAAISATAHAARTAVGEFATACLSSTSRMTFASPATSHAITAGVTKLVRFAGVATEVSAAGGSPPKASIPLTRRLATTVRHAVGWQAEVAWMHARMGPLRTQACGVGPRAQACPTSVLHHLRGDSPIIRFWSDPQLRGARSSGAQQAAFDELDRRSLPPHLALAISFACNAVAREIHPGGRSVAEGLQWLERTDVAKLRAALARPLGIAELPTAGQMAVEILSRLADNNAFPAMMRRLSPAFDEARIPVLRRLLQARQAEASSSRGSNVLAARVHRSAARELAAPGTPRDRRERVDAFLWDNRFRDDGPLSELAEVKHHFFTLLSQLARSPNEAGLLRAARTYGLGGGDRHILADETSKLFARLRDAHGHATPALRDMTEPLRAHLSRAIDSHRDAMRAAGDGAPPASLVLAIAQAVALDAWSGCELGSMTLADVARGRPIDPAGAAVRARCEDFVASLDSTQSPAGSISSLQGPFGYPGRPRLDRLVEAATQRAQTLRLDFASLADLARQTPAGLSPVAAQLASDVSAALQAQSPRLVDPSPRAVGELFAGYLENVQFGNHVKLFDTRRHGGGLPRGTAVNIASFLPPGPVDRLHVPILLRAELRGEKTTERFVRMGAATHSAEIIMGTEEIVEAVGGLGAQAGHSALGSSVNLARLVAGADATGFTTSRSYRGAMFRIDRQVVEDASHEDPPRFQQNDADVRQTAARMARELFSNGGQNADAALREDYFESFLDRFMDSGLSLTLMEQGSESRRVDTTLAASGSVRTPGFYGARFALGGSYSYENTPSLSLRAQDKTGIYRVRNMRDGWSTRHRLDGDLGSSVITGASGAPAVPLLGSSTWLGEGGGSVRVRVPERDGEIVAEKSFSDTETPDLNLFKEIVLSDKPRWIELFAYPHRHLGAAEALRRGEAAVDEFFVKATRLHSGHHVYYARERMHPDVARRLDELAAVDGQLDAGDPQLASLKDEIAGERQRLAADDRSWNPASLIAYERATVQDGVGISAVGVKLEALQHWTGRDTEREILFDTIGWAALRKRENAFPPSHLDTP